MTKKFSFYANESGEGINFIRDFDSLSEAQGWIKKNVNMDEMFPEDVRIVNNLANPGEKNIIQINSDYTLKAISHFKPLSRQELPRIEVGTCFDVVVMENFHSSVRNTISIEYVDKEAYKEISSSMHDEFFDLAYMGHSPSRSLDLDEQETFMIVRDSNSEVIGLSNFMRTQRKTEFFEMQSNSCDYRFILDFVYLVESKRCLGYGQAIMEAMTQIVEQDLEFVIDAVGESGSKFIVEFASEPVTPQGLSFSENLSSEINFLFDDIVAKTIDRNGKSVQRRMPEYEPAIEY